MFREWRELEPRAPSARARAATVAVKENAETEAIAAALASSRQKRWLANNPARGSLSAVKSRLSRKGLVDVVGNAIYHDPGYQSKRGEAPRSDRDADAILGLANVAADAAEARQRDAEIGLDATRADQRLIGRVAPSVAALWKGVDVDEFHDALVKERLVEWLFPSKTYAMINGLDGTVGGWSDAGDSMVILDAENFASEVIPQYFKHNNFRSFVRQLNFYGFRKLRADPSAGPSTPPRWEFKHVNFRRGRPELLVQIRLVKHDAMVEERRASSAASGAVPDDDDVELVDAPAAPPRAAPPRAAPPPPPRGLSIGTGAVGEPDAAPVDGARNAAELAAPAPKRRKVRQEGPPKFVVKLVEMIEQTGVISFEGGVLIIPSTAALEQRLGDYYSKAKLASFQSQLANYGFKRDRLSSFKGSALYRKVEGGEHVTTVQGLLSLRPFPARRKSPPAGSASAPVAAAPKKRKAP